MSKDQGTALRYGRKGEDAWTSDLVVELRAQKLGAMFQPIYHCVEAGRRVLSKPDLQVTDGGVSVGSAKLGEDKVIKALSTAQEYQVKLQRAEELRDKTLREVFAITYPNNRGERFHLLALPRPHRPQTLTYVSENLQDLARKIASVIRREEGRLHAVPLTEEAPLLLRYGAQELAETIQNVRQEDLEGVFGGHHFFQAVLATPLAERKERLETLRLGAAFLFVNQVFFYVLLSRAAGEGEQGGDYPPISEADQGNPRRLNDYYFRKVLDKNYEPIYGVPVARLFTGRNATEACRDIVRALTALAPGMGGRDLAGQVFQTLIPYSIRKPLGAYYTNPRAAELLASISIDRPDAKVLDPACGSGTLLVASYHRKAALAGDAEGRLHKQFVEREITGIDAMAFAAHLAAVNLSLQQPLFETDHVRIATTDSTRFKPGDDVVTTEEVLSTELRQATLLHRFGGARPKSRPKGPVRMGRREPGSFRLEPVDLVIMNPPFTSRDRMAPEYRDGLARKFESGDYGKATSGKKISQQAYFLLLADRFLKEGGKVAAVLPMSTFNGFDYWPLVDFLLQNYTVRFVVVGMGRASFSEQTSLSESLFIAEKQKPPKGATFRLVGTLKSPPDWSHGEAEAVAEAARQGRGVEGLSVVQEFPQADLAPEGAMLSGLALRLAPEFDAAYAAFSKICPVSPLPLVRFEEWRNRGVDYKARLEEVRHLGKLGASALLAVREERRALKAIDRLVLDSETREHIAFRDRIGGARYRFPKSEVRSALRRMAYMERMNGSRDTDFCVAVPGAALENAMNAIYGTRAAKSSLSVLRKKDMWKNIVPRNSARVIVADRCDFAAPGTIHLCHRFDEPVFNTAQCIARDFIDAAQEKLFCLWVNSTFGLLQIVSTSGLTRGSWVHVYRNALDRVLLPEYPGKTPGLPETIDRLWKTLGEVAFPSLIEQLEGHHPSRVALDDAILALLGVVDKKEREELGRTMRIGVAAAIRTLQRTMGEGAESEEQSEDE